MLRPGPLPNLFPAGSGALSISFNPGWKRTLAAGILLLFTCAVARAQITSDAANYRDSVGYPTRVEKDPLFVFYQANGAHKPGSLAATHPVTGNYDFEWSRYNPALPGFDTPFHSDPGTASSSVSGLEEGGYRVRISDGISVDTTMIAWVMLDNLVAETDKNAEGKIRPFNYTCDFLVISGSVATDTFTYYDPLTHDAIPLSIDFRFKWTSDNQDLRIPNDSTILDPNITYLPPVRDTWYILTATDELGMVDVDSVLYESIQTRAKFSIEYYDKVRDTMDASLTGSWSKGMGSLDAPLTVRFINESENGASFEWVFLDTLGGIRQTETTYDVDTYTEYTYERADEYYYPYMVSKSEEECTDTFRLEQAIYVEPSQLEIPNVFTPNGDGTNDFFVFKHQSIKSCRLTIVDRWGKVVYKRDIEDIYQWEGWDGNLHDSDRRAPEGQYYYVVEAMGYDGVEYSDPTIFENWKLNRGNKNDRKGTTGSQPQEPEKATGNLYTGWLYLFRGIGAY
jgi:gliding motility-associated-like protein